MTQHSAGRPSEIEPEGRGSVAALPSQPLRGADAAMPAGSIPTPRALSPRVVVDDGSSSGRTDALAGGSSARAFPAGLLSPPAVAPPVTVLSLADVRGRR
jgi:hypothetical protein